MQHYDVSTYEPKLYSDYDTEKLKERIKDLEMVVAAYREKQVGPYRMAIKIEADTWQGVMAALATITIENDNGPKENNRVCLGFDYEVLIESNLNGGKGEAVIVAPDPMSKLTKKG